jgi:TRAP-type C4-dicarboxylate transport system permease small subunit
MNGLHKSAQLLSTLLDGVISIFFAIILVVTILQVILRYVFNESILGGNELMEGLFIYTTSIGAAVAVRRRQHISISYVVERLPPFMQRLSDIVVHLLIAVLNLIMIGYAIRWIGKVGSNESPVLRLPEWLFQISVPIGCALVIFYCLVMIVIAFMNNDQETGNSAC